MEGNFPLNTVDIIVDICDPDKRTLEDVKYAAFSLSGSVYVKIEPAPNKTVQVILTSRDHVLPANIIERFDVALEEERLRSLIAENNRPVFEYVIGLALRGEPQPSEAQEESLDEAQQQELDQLIAEVEKEIKKESTNLNDPLNILKTWEDVHSHSRTGNE